jgi:steroid delta-isomerase
MDMSDLPYASLNAVKARDREAWLDLFDDDAVVEDPVGPSEWDPEGRGRRGKAEIAAFYDMFAQHQSGFDYAIHHMEVGGDEVALFGSLFITSLEGAQSETKILNVYRRSASGKIVSLRSFWNY